MNYKLLSLFIILIVASCTSGPSVSFTSEIFSNEDLAICKNDPCSMVDITYPVASGDVINAEKINKEIKDFIVTSLFLGDETPNVTKTIEEAATDFIMGYRDHQADVAGDIDMGGYEAKINMNDTYNTEGLISIEASTYFFTGGANAYGNITNLNFNPDTGEQIDIEEIVNDFNEFENFMMQKFRTHHKIEECASINSPGFWFEDETFYVSNNIGFSNNFLTIIYNIGEIAPYSKGPTVLEIPINEVQHFFEIELVN